MPAGPPFACGKLILAGEHAVVYGRPALGMGIGSIKAVKLKPSDRLSFHVPDWGISANAGNDTPFGQALRKLLPLLPSGISGLDVTFRSDLPFAAGLGSSAALSVALVRAVRQAFDLPLDDEAVREYAHELENIFHGQASGLDDTLAAYGGLCLFRRTGFTDGGTCERLGLKPLNHQTYRLPCAPPPLVVGFSGVPHQTQKTVAALRRQRDDDPVRVEALLDGIAESVEAALTALLRGDRPALGAAFNADHAILRELGISCPEIETMIESALTAGAFGAKLTGGGGGGAVFALAPGREAEVAERWRHAGFRVLELTPAGTEE